MSPAATKSAAAAWPVRWSRPPSSSIPDRYIPRIGDSKTVTGARAEPALRPHHPGGGRLGRGGGDPREIDTINIHQASLRAMQRAVLQLVPLPDFVLVDAFRIPGPARWPSAP